jgi:hypothetical protein
MKENVAVVVTYGKNERFFGPITKLDSKNIVVGKKEIPIAKIKTCYKLI